MSTREVLLDITQPVVLSGMRVEQATAAMIMIHGRGATSQDILSYVPLLNQPTFTYLAPEAPDNTWYPDRFLAPLEKNEPYLSSSLELIGQVVSFVINQGIPAERIVLFGFSQGACLALEYAARHARRYGAVVGLSGGLIGPDDLERDAQGSLDDMPVFLGCSDIDFHVPQYRVERTADTFRQLGADVTLRFYPNMEHTINHDELGFVHHLMSTLLST